MVDPRGIKPILMQMSGGHLLSSVQKLGLPIFNPLMKRAINVNRFPSVLYIILANLLVY